MDGLRLLQALAVEEVCVFLMCTFDCNLFPSPFPSIGARRNSGSPFLFPDPVANPVNCAMI